VGVGWWGAVVRRAPGGGLRSARAVARVELGCNGWPLGWSSGRGRFRLAADGQDAWANVGGRPYLTLASSPGGRPLCLVTCPSAAAGRTDRSTMWWRRRANDRCRWRRTGTFDPLLPVCRGGSGSLRGRSAAVTLEHKHESHEQAAWDRLSHAGPSLPNRRVASYFAKAVRRFDTLSASSSKPCAFWRYLMCRICRRSNGTSDSCCAMRITS